VFELNPPKSHGQPSNRKLEIQLPMHVDSVQPLMSGEYEPEPDPEELADPDEPELDVPEPELDVPDPEAPEEPDEPDPEDPEPDEPEEPEEPEESEPSGVTTIWNDAVAVLPCPSEAVHVTVVVPIGNVPAPWSQRTPTGPSVASSAVGVVYETKAPAELVAATVIVPGTFEMTGGVVSVAGAVTVTVKLIVREVFPWLSWA
jgi:hypothetical protein